MSDALTFATAAPGVHSSRYGRCLRQRDFNNASDNSTVLEAPSSSVVALKKGKLVRFQLRCIHNPPLSSRHSSTPLPSKTHKLRPSAAA
jgi:hypothetical protein